MSIADIFESFAADFELALNDDNWSRLKKYFTEDATYKNVGDPGSECEGPDAILSYLKADVNNFDRKFDSRSLVALTPVKVTGNRLSRLWQTTFILKETPGLIVEGEARYQFHGELIKAIEEELSPGSLQKLSKWMQYYGNKLHR